MRIISGWLGGRNFQSPHGHRTHPMSEKIRGAIFGALGDIKGLTALDAFAGSGALAFEAISRGATQAVAIEVDKGAHTVIVQNMKELGIQDRVKATRAFFSAWSARNQRQAFDLVFADPPFDDIPYRDLKFLPRHLKDDGTLVVNWPGKERHLTFEGLQIVQNKNYGDAQLVFYQKIS
jgi:16S rRNA (guanine966-N2)-methyltransferase